ncbi:hypothetical protein F5J12DRAFT_779566 [Pisolithus orientalis]|uniref:uncharacterized protein n=1 Tax=Pisolithus orientalis TaxID=936130 RepID=UPI00222504A9|nr:uncharacterized protein F5J12DRAFT_779566 [Pisolithus orientalis]KAI6030404.1 hypothetical protein F5J12DRAFT_779566 [Pisolithus orientalis]
MEGTMDTPALSEGQTNNKHCKLTQTPATAATRVGAMEYWSQSMPEHGNQMVVQMVSTALTGKIREVKEPKGPKQWLHTVIPKGDNVVADIKTTEIAEADACISQIEHAVADMSLGYALMTVIHDKPDSQCDLGSGPLLKLQEYNPQDVDANHLKKLHENIKMHCLQNQAIWNAMVVAVPPRHGNNPIVTLPDDDNDRLYQVLNIIATLESAKDKENYINEICHHTGGSSKSHPAHILSDEGIYSAVTPLFMGGKLAGLTQEQGSLLVSWTVGAQPQVVLEKAPKGEGQGEMTEEAKSHALAKELRAYARKVCVDMAVKVGWIKAGLLNVQHVFSDTVSTPPIELTEVIKESRLARVMRVWGQESTLHMEGGHHPGSQLGEWSDCIAKWLHSHWHQLLIWKAGIAQLVDDLGSLTVLPGTPTTQPLASTPCMEGINLTATDINPLYGRWASPSGINHAQVNVDGCHLSAVGQASTVQPLESTPYVVVRNHPVELEGNMTEGNESSKGKHLPDHVSQEDTDNIIQAEKPSRKPTTQTAKDKGPVADKGPKKTACGVDVHGMKRQAVKQIQKDWQAYTNGKNLELKTFVNVTYLDPWAKAFVEHACNTNTFDYFGSTEAADKQKYDSGMPPYWHEVEKTCNEMWKSAKINWLRSRYFMKDYCTWHIALPMANKYLALAFLWLFLGEKPDKSGRSGMAMAIAEVGVQVTSWQIGSDLSWAVTWVEPLARYMIEQWDTQAKENSPLKAWTNYTLALSNYMEGVKDGEDKVNVTTPLQWSAAQLINKLCNGEHLLIWAHMSEHYNMTTPICTVFKPLDLGITIEFKYNTLCRFVFIKDGEEFAYQSTIPP